MPDRRRFFTCPLSNEVVELENAKTNHDGKAVHEECYAQALDRSGEDNKAKPGIVQEPRYR